MDEKKSEKKSVHSKPEIRKKIKPEEKTVQNNDVFDLEDMAPIQQQLKKEDKTVRQAANAGVSSKGTEEDLRNTDDKNITERKEEKNNSSIRIKEKEEDTECTAFNKEFVSADEPEKEKHIGSMVFDMVDVGIVEKGRKKGEYVNFTIVPLEAPRKDKAICDIFVCMETENMQSVCSSEADGRKTVTTKIGNYEFIIKGAWKDQKFISTIYPTNQMITDEYVKNEDRHQFMPRDPKVIGYGHNVMIINEKSGGITKVHTIPLDLENDDQGIVNIMVCVENSVKKRSLYASNGNLIFHNTEEYSAQILGFWKDNIFVSDVKIIHRYRA